jgi:hypothetical protein
MVAVLKEDRKALKELVRESSECYEHTNKLKYSIMPALRRMKSSSVEVSLYYVQVVDYLSEITKAILHITRPAFEHIDNNHKGLSEEQTNDLMHINDDVAEIYGNINRMITDNDFHDIDLLGCEEDIEVAKEILLRRGKLLPTKPDSKYDSRHFLEFEVDGVEIDLIAGFVINSADGEQHVCPLEMEEVDACVDVADVAVSLHSLSVWYRYYTWMGRTDRVKQIEEHLGIK